MKRRWFSKSIVLILLCVFISGMQGLVCEATSPLKAPSSVRISRNSNTSLKLRWSKVKEADGYIIYRYNKDTKEFRKLKTINNRNTHFFIDKVGKNKSAKYKISAYKFTNGKKASGNQSVEVSARTYKKGDRKVNVGQVKTKIVGSGFLYAEVAYHENLQLSATVKPSKYSNAKDKVVLNKKVSWYSSNSKIASVDKNGVVTAKAKIGTCYIYSRAHNGNKSNQIKIIVGNYAKPYKGNLVLWPAEDNPQTFGATLELFNRFYGDVTYIAEYFSANRPSGNKTYECWFEKGQIKMSANYEISTEMQKKIYNFMNKFPYDLHIYATSDYVSFNEMYGIYENQRKAITNVVYLYDKNKKNPYAYKELYDVCINWQFGLLR
jgi:Bacterial Ig-like domain (group 2).